MKTLYISDLDGTLLNDKVEISDKTAKELNILIDNGLNFTAATARTNATVTWILKNVKINLPVILMNGVAMYDMQTDTFMHIENISCTGKHALINTIGEHIKSGFIYTIDNGKLTTYYENTSSPTAVQFIEEREKRYNKKFTKVSSFDECINKNIVYYSICDTYEKLKVPYEEMKKCRDLHIEFYRDIYNTDCWYLEICSCTASKKNAVLNLKNEYDFDKVISFGDNLNDLPMFDVSDESYAVANAKQEVKDKATGVIGANTDDGVIEFLKTHRCMR